MNQTSFTKQKPTLNSLIKVPEKRDIFLAFLTFLCQRSQLLGFNPFGCILFCAVGKRESFYLYVAAILSGSLLSNAQTAKYVAASLLISLFKLFYAEKENKKIINFCIAPVAVFLCGLVSVFIMGTHIEGVASLFLESVFSLTAYAVFSDFNTLLDRRRKNLPATKENAVCFLILTMLCIRGLSNIPIPLSISLETIACIYMILCLSMYSSFQSCAAFALICGFVGCSDEKSALSCGGVFGISAIFASLLKGFGQAASAIGFISGITICILTAGNFFRFPLSASDIIIGTLAFSMLPPKFNRHTGVFLANIFKFDCEGQNYRIRDYIAEELNTLSVTFSEFARRFKTSFQKGTDNIFSPSSLFDETASRICSDCTHFCDCWQKNFNDTYKYMFSILDATEKHGECTVKNAPVVFTQRCVQPELFLNEFNHIYEINKSNILEKGIRFGEREFVSDQYIEISKVISNLSEEIGESFFFDEEKEKQILSECSKEGIYLKDLNVVHNSDGYCEMYYSVPIDSDEDELISIAERILGIKLKSVICKNKSIKKLICANSYAVSIGFFQKEKETEPVSGDTLVHFETDKGKYYVILCDGMGSGCDASRESKMTADLLSGFLKAGFSKNTAVNLINSTLALKMDREGFSTIDLCEIDLRSGRTEFIKIGGAQSYIKSGGTIETVSLKGIPAGICESINTDNIKRQLSDGDMVVMVSDGVSEAGYGLMRGEWVKGFMKSDEYDNQKLAEKIVGSARKKIYPRIPDDMSAVVITLHKTETVAQAISA